MAGAVNYALERVPAHCGLPQDHAFATALLPQSLMFTTVEVGHELVSAQFDRLEPALRLRLLQAQRQLARSHSSAIVIVCGVETARRNRGVNRLNAWLDPRGVQITGHWHDTDGEALRPQYWRYWRRLPSRGHIGILLGAWYERLILMRARKAIHRSAFAAELKHITTMERMLADDGAIIVKLWFHISKVERAQRMRAILRQTGRKKNPHEKHYDARFERILQAAETAIQSTDCGGAAWHLIDAADGRYRDVMAGQIIAAAIEQGTSQQVTRKRARRGVPSAGKHLTVLNAVDLSLTLTEQRYRQEMEDLRGQLNALAWQAHEARRSTVILFEGWDGSGKGGVIRRLVTALDARLTQVIQIATPTDEERAQHYLWRFWRHLPPDGYFTVYDRSWYGRVLVERVEGLASPQEWDRAFGEINDFEAQLRSHGITLLKFWMHISKDEQLRRFRDRERTPFKHFKITPEDWRNRKKWRDYELAVDEMVARTSTAPSPWTLVAANCKRYARVTVLRTLVKRMKKAAGR